LKTAVSRLLFKKRSTLLGEIVSTIPRLIASLAISLALQSLIGRPDALGSDKEMAIIWALHNQVMI
jgi:hypothetical protein